MNRSETSRALEMLTIYQPNTPKPDNPELTVDTWAYELADFEFADVRDAIRKLCMDARRPGTPWLVELRDISTEVCAQRAKRLAERRHLIQPPSGLDPDAYRAWLIASDRAVMARDWTPPPALEAGRHDPRPAITALANAYAPEENR